MKYHVVSTSRTGHGAIFTNAGDAKSYRKLHPGSAYKIFDRIPIRIPSIETAGKIVDNPEKTCAGSNLEIIVYTDGSALGNPGPGGYGVVIVKNKKTIELSKGYKHTTNNRMEMMAVIAALEELGKTEKPVKIFSDSQYTLNGITKGWARNWRKNGWKKSDGKPAKNSDLWGRILDIVDRFPELSFQWVRGHAGNSMNERADELANGIAQTRALSEDTGYCG